MTLVSLITESGLRALAGDQSLAHYVEHLECGAIRALIKTGDVRKEHVFGRQEHEVPLAESDRQIDCVCASPVAKDDALCKCAVAVAFSSSSTRRRRSVPERRSGVLYPARLNTIVK